MHALLGETFAVLSAMSFALAGVVITRTAASRGDKGVLFSVVVTIAFSFAIFLAVEAGRVEIWATSGTLLGLALFALAGLTAMTIGRSLVFESIRRLGAFRASAVKRLNPFFSVVLAAVFLGEAVTDFDLLGLAAIALAFGLLIRENMRRRGVADGATGGGPGLGAFGVGAAAAFAYAISYIARKAGLDHLGAPAFGTFFSAVSGFVGFALLALVSPAYRQMFRGMFRNVDRYVAGAAILISVGQILMFAALAHEKVSTVVMISSLEVFFSIFLVTVVFRTEARPGAGVFAAAAFAVAGVILVAGG